MKRMTQLLRQTLLKINKVCLLTIGKDYQSLIKVLLSFYEDIEKSSGTRFAIDEFKAVYNESTRYVFDKTIKTPFTQRYHKRNKSGFIQKLSLLRLNLDSATVDEARMILSLLRSYEQLTVTPIPKIETITAVGVGTEGYKTFDKAFKEFLVVGEFPRQCAQNYDKQLKRVRDDGEPLSMHYTVKKGINGSALGNAGTQSLAITGKLKDSLVQFSDHFKRGLARILDYNQNLYNNKVIDIGPITKRDILKTYHVKVVCIPDKGTKNRLIAIGNYWLQNSLKYLHEITYEILRNIPTDGTHNQESQFNRVMERTKVGPVWSFDLTAATDRFPRTIQADVLARLDPKVSQLWVEILSNIKVIYENKEITYGTGQPMGLYSSWSTFTLTHHMLIQFCAYRCGKIDSTTIFSDYAIIGDDIAIWNEEVSLCYQHFIDILDVDINLRKSFIPKSTTVGPWEAEFAKRICKNGIEYSAIAPGIISETTKRLWGLPELLNYLFLHNFLNLPSRVTYIHIQSVFGYKPRQLRMLGWCFHINHLLGGPSFDRLTFGEESKYSEVSLVKLFQRRYNLLVEDQILSLMAPLGLSGQDRDQLNQLFGEEVSTNVAVSLVYRQLTWERILLTKRLKKEFGINTRYFINDLADIGQPISEFDKLRSVEVSVPLNEISHDKILENLKAIEYLPIIKFSEIREGITLHNNKRFYKMAYIERLVRTILDDDSLPSGAKQLQK